MSREIVSQASQLCQSFGYPDVLREILDEVVALAARTSTDLVGVVVSPSTSSGDFLWKQETGRVTLLSDVDGFVFARTTSEQREQFRIGLRELAIAHQDGLFKLDFSVNDPRELDRLAPSFQMVETRLGGFELAGSGLLERFPDRFDPRASRQAFLLNLYKPIAAQGDEAWSQSCARLLLDIPLLATSEMGVCLPGHRRRAEWFLSERPGRIGEHPIILEAVEAALAARVAPPGSRKRLEPLMLPALAATIAALDRGVPPPPRPNEALIRRFSSWLPPRSMRRLGGELRTILQRRTHLLDDYRWWRVRKEAVGGGVVWGLLQSSYGEEPANEETARWLAAYCRREKLEPEGSEFLAKASADYRRGLFDLYPTLEAE